MSEHYGQKAMSDEMPIHHAARQLIERYGADAPKEARMRANELAAAGDTEGHSLWCDIHDTAVEMLRGPPGPTSVN